jgi:hypothetical protein
LSNSATLESPSSSARSLRALKRNSFWTTTFGYHISKTIQPIRYLQYHASANPKSHSLLANSPPRDSLSLSQHQNQLHLIRDITNLSRLQTHPCSSCMKTIPNPSINCLTILSLIQSVS